MRSIITIVIFAFSKISIAQPDSLELQAKEYFEAVKLATERNFDLWDMNLHGPMILVEPFKRKVYASESDLEGDLSKSNGIYVGKFPKTLNISGAYIDWGGKTWAMLPYMFPQDVRTEDVVGYLGHELFHRSQKKLGFIFPNEVLNDHLDQNNGRIYLRLELQALMVALEESSKKLAIERITDALIFRKYRHQLYNENVHAENLLELNEGITQYTTVILRGRAYDSDVNYLKKVASIFLNGPTYVRTFAYHTIPAYGLLLNKKKKYWNKEVSIQTNLTDYFIDNFGIDIPANLDSAVQTIMPKYNGSEVIAEEEERAKRLAGEIEQLIKALIEEPHLEIAITRNNMSFDPSNVTPLEGLGAVYKGSVRWSDKWGVLEVKNGLFLDENGDRICATLPDSIEIDYARGADWELWLNDGYKLIRNQKTGNYIIQPTE